MSTWFKWFVVLAPVALIACSGTAEPQKGGGGPGGDDDDDAADGGDDDDDVTTSGDSFPYATDSYYVPPDPFEPGFVSFELDAVVLLDQSLTGYDIEDYGYSPPTLVLTFTSYEYFGADDTEQAAQSCLAWGEFLFPISLAKPDQIPLQGATVLYASYDGAINLEYTTCAGRVTPATWGDYAEYLLGPFHGAHFGVGFGPMTDYLRDAWGDETLADYEDNMLAEYIALNDIDGNFVGIDWNTAFAWEYDEANGTLASDAKGLLLPVSVGGLDTGDDLPQAYIRSIAYWYQDFPLMDLSNLHDGAPALP